MGPRRGASSAPDQVTTEIGPGGSAPHSVSEAGRGRCGSSRDPRIGRCGPRSRLDARGTTSAPWSAAHRARKGRSRGRCCGPRAAHPNNRSPRLATGDGRPPPPPVATGRSPRRPACPGPGPREQHAVRCVQRDVFPCQGRSELRGPEHLGVVGASPRPGAQHAPDEDNAAKAGDEGPRIESLAGEHEQVALGPTPAGRCEHHLVSELREDPPAHRHLGRIEIRFGDGDQDCRHPGTYGWLAKAALAMGLPAASTTAAPSPWAASCCPARG